MIKNIVLILIIFFSFLNCKGHIDKSNSKSFIKEAISHSPQKKDSFEGELVKKQKFNNKIEKDSISEDSFCLFLKSKNVLCVYEEKYDENHFLNEVFILKNQNLIKIFELIKEYEFGTDVIIDKNIKLENVKIEKEIPYYTQTVQKKNGVVLEVDCEFMFDGGTTTIKLKQQDEDTIITIMYST